MAKTKNTNNNTNKNNNVSSITNETKPKKPVSHFERLLTPSAENNYKQDRLMYKLQYTKELDCKTNRIARKAKKVIKDRYEEMKNYKVSDFSLENLQAIGVELNSTSLSRSNLNTIQEIESAINYNINNNNE